MVVFKRSVPTRLPPLDGSVAGPPFVFCWVKPLRVVLPFQPAAFTSHCCISHWTESTLNPLWSFPRRTSAETRAIEFGNSPLTVMQLLSWWWTRRLMTKNGTPIHRVYKRLKIKIFTEGKMWQNDNIFLHVWKLLSIVTKIKVYLCLRWPLKLFEKSPQYLQFLWTISVWHKAMVRTYGEKDVYIHKIGNIAPIVLIFAVVEVSISRDAHIYFGNGGLLFWHQVTFSVLFWKEMLFFLDVKVGMSRDVHMFWWRLVVIFQQ